MVFEEEYLGILFGYMTWFGMQAWRPGLLVPTSVVHQALLTTQARAHNTSDSFNPTEHDRVV